MAWEDVTLSHLPKPVMLRTMSDHPNSVLKLTAKKALRAETANRAPGEHYYLSYQISTEKEVIYEVADGVLHFSEQSKDKFHFIKIDIRQQDKNYLAPHLVGHLYAQTRKQ